VIINTSRKLVALWSCENEKNSETKLLQEREQQFYWAEQRTFCFSSTTEKMSATPQLQRVIIPETLSGDQADEQ
jgi:hypothetical protein